MTSFNDLNREYELVMDRLDPAEQEDEKPDKLYIVTIVESIYRTYKVNAPNEEAAIETAAALDAEEDREPTDEVCTCYGICAINEDDIPDDDEEG
jgi:hypothetical protein